MSVEPGTRTSPVPPGLIVREAAVGDNASLIALELQSPVRIGGADEFFDRSPDAFARHRLQGEYRIVLAELDGGVVGVMAGVIHAPVIQGHPHRLVYIHRARVGPAFHHRGVAWSLANDLFAWARERGAEGPYYLIAPQNERSIAFGGRAGRRWPVDVTLLALDVSEARGGRLERVPEKQLREAAALVNATHAGEDFFEPLTAESLAGRLSRDRQHSLDNFYGISDGGRLIAVGGLWDRGATTERIHVERATGATTRSRGAALVDWGWAPGRSETFIELLRCVAAEARALGRSILTICEPSPGALPDSGLPGRRSSVSLFTPTIEPPPAESIRGLYVDLLYL